ncbi:MAG: hypothetical protein J6J67_05735 [Treponema sp.]|nr:hypothetical protein [Treponema sp.]
MAKKNMVKLSFEEGGNYSAELIPLKRKTIYGERKIIAVDKEGQECKRILYDESDMTLLPKNSVGICKLDEEGKIYVKNPEEENFKKEGEYSDYFANDNRLIEISEDDAYLYPSVAKDVYTLEGYDAVEVARRIGEKIFRYKNRDLVFQRKGCVFWLKPNKGVQVGIYAEKSIGYQADDEPIISDITSLDEIDFDMF